MSSVEAAQRLFHDAMEVDVDAEYLAAAAAFETFDHAVGLGRTGMVSLSAKVRPHVY